MTSATDRLRALLDERGVEWRRTPHYSSESIDNETVFRGEGIEWIANDHLNGRLGLRALRYEVTPEQAVAATLGPGTCRDVRSEDATIAFECSECGCWVAYDEYWETGIYIQGEGQQVHIHPRYCPECGRKVVEKHNMERGRYGE